MDKNLTDAKRVIELTRAEDVNKYIGCGWVLIGNVASRNEDGGGHMLYSLAWFRTEEPVFPPEPRPKYGTVL